MATSSNFTTSNGYIVYNIEVIGNSINVNNNTSNITVKVSCWRTNTGYTTWGNGTCYCKINGTTYSSGITNDQSITSSSRVLFTKTLDIGHNDDGTKSIYVSAWINHDRFSSSEQGFNVTLTTIPRASSFTLSSNDVNAGTKITGSITRASSGFTHNVYLGFGTKRWTIGTGIGTSFSYTIPMETLNEIPSAVKGQGNIQVDTYNGSTLVGKKAVNFYISAGSNIVPSISAIKLSRDNSGYPSDWTEYVANISKVTANITAAGTYGSTISSYSVSGKGVNVSGTSNSLKFIPTTSGYPITLTFKATDTRGRSVTTTRNISVYWYEPPKITTFKSFRCNSLGNADDDGSYLKCTAEYSYDGINNKNSIVESVVEVRKSNESKWKKLKESIEGSNNTFITGGGSVSPDYAWVVRLRVNDKYTSSTYEIKIPTASTTMDFLKGGKGIAIGSVCDKEGLTVDWQTVFNKGIDVQNLDANTHDSYYIRLFRGNTGLRGAGITSDSNGLGLRIHMYDDSGTWKSHYVFQNDGIFSTSGLNVRGSQVTIGKEGDNSSWIGFHDTVQRVGWVGKGSRAADTISITAETGDLHLRTESGNMYFFLRGTDYRLAGDSGRRFGVSPVVSPSDGVMEIGTYIDFHSSSEDTGDYSFRLQTGSGILIASGSIQQGSDIKLKKDIMYVDDMIAAQNAMLLDDDFDKSNISTNTSFKDFLVNDFKFATFKYKDSDAQQFGFIAQDIENNDLSSFILREVEDYNKTTGEKTKKLTYDLSAFTSVVARALQEEIKEKDKKIEKLEKRVEDLENKIKGE